MSETEQAAGPPAPIVRGEPVEIAPGVFVLPDGRVPLVPNVGIIVGSRGTLVVDPGLGFAKTADQNWELLRGLDAFDELGLPVLVGASRKAFLGRLLPGADGEPRPVPEREHAHVALVALLAARGVWGLRVHDVRATRDALAVVGRMAP